MACLQYYYENPEDREKYKINCEGKIFPTLYDIEKYTSKDMYNFIDANYSSKAFPAADISPFEFRETYIDKTNDEICKIPDMSLTPQQKFMGQIMGPSSNFNNMLIFHGLGSGKSCTSIVIGEALKNSTNRRLIFTVPAPLVDQYFEEIAGEIRNGKYFSCPSFCLRRGDGDGDEDRDYYVSDVQNAMLNLKMTEVNRAYELLERYKKLIDEGDTSQGTKKLFTNQENKHQILVKDLAKQQAYYGSSILRTFDIVSHQTFINSLYKTGKTGAMIKGDRLLNSESALFSENGLLIIDEVQRLVSEGGIFYKKLYDSIKYYFHPKLKIAVMSATPVYDNPYELALTINLLRPRIPFPISQKDFYKFFIGEMDEEGNCFESTSGKTWVSQNSCVINKNLISYLCSGYVSYFKGGNPNAYPYKRTITLEHLFTPQHKTLYISALVSDASKDKNTQNASGFDVYQNILLGNYDTSAEDKVTGIYVTTQQYSNIALPQKENQVNKTYTQKKEALQIFKNELLKRNLEQRAVLDFVTQFSNKFSKIIELTLLCNGPVFIFSNWLTYGVEPLATILEACGFKSFDLHGPGENRYFIWSSETKNKDKTGDLIKKARNQFNSPNNNTGKILKVILGTRSVMEGVSFRNVKQVHITEPWWNESRINQIIARASRYCSHSSLPHVEQYVDIYRHYSVFSIGGKNIDKEASEALKIGNVQNWRSLSSVSIDQKMAMMSLRKYAINTELENLLKECSIDVNINKNGNILRLEEMIVPLTDGTYNIHYKNPSSGKIYLRKDIPRKVNFNEIYDRKYSFPNKEYELEFVETGQNKSGEFIIYEDSEIIKDDLINADLNMVELLTPWENDYTINTIEISREMKLYFIELAKKYSLIPSLRKKYLNESGTKFIKFDHTKNKAGLLMKCITILSTNMAIPLNVRREMIELIKKDSVKQKINEDVIKLITTYGYPESYLEEFLILAANNPGSIREALNSVK
jgi:hypothetical protein